MNRQPFTQRIRLSCVLALAAACGGAAVERGSQRSSTVTFSGACIGDVRPDRIDLLAGDDVIETAAARPPVPVNSAVFAAASHHLAGPTNTGICVADHDTRKSACFDGIAAEDYAISPDGRWLAYNGVDRPAGGKGLFVLEVESGRRTRISASGRRPSWSPDANQIVYEDQSTIRTISPTGGAARPIAAGTDPSWSPTEGVIVYRSPGETFERVSPEGRSGGTVADARGFLGPLQWSPDGRYLLGSKLGWTRDRSRPCQHDHVTILVINATDGAISASHPYCGPGAWRYTWIPVPSICSSPAVR